MRRAAVGLALVLASGCGPPPRQWRARPTVVRPRRHIVVVHTAGPLPVRPPPPASAAGFVERALRERGLRFGTDGTVRGLYQLLRARYSSVAPAQARAGDVVFFALDGARCGTHAGLVEAVEAGRIAFRERRDGETRLSFATPAAPATRRDPQGRILNTFLRPRRPEDPPGLRYFSGEMLCAVVRIG
jgi:hypothetical protein